MKKRSSWLYYYYNTKVCIRKHSAPFYHTHFFHFMFKLFILNYFIHHLHAQFQHHDNLHLQRYPMIILIILNTMYFILNFTPISVSFPKCSTFSLWGWVGCSVAWINSFLPVLCTSTKHLTKAPSTTNAKSPVIG